jgi:uncharacterized protein
LRFLVIDCWASSEAYVDLPGGAPSPVRAPQPSDPDVLRQESVIGRFDPVIPPAGLTVECHHGTRAVWRLDRAASVPDWAQDTELCSITRTADELSVVWPDGAVPEDVVAQGRWRCLRVAGPLDFGLTGIAAALTTPLAAAGIPVMIIATYDTDYLPSVGSS